MKSQGCFICKIARGKMNIDHDHKTGAVRGVLCNACNIMIGYIERTEQFKDEIADYLSTEKAIAV